MGPRPEIKRDLRGIDYGDLDRGVEHARKRHSFDPDNNLQCFQIAIGICLVRDTEIRPEISGSSRDSRCASYNLAIATLAIRAVVVNSLFLVPPFA